MTGTDLEERLARLAEGDVGATAPAPEELWTRGRRWQRRRRVVGGATVAGVTLCALGLVATVLPTFVDTAPSPASDHAVLMVPDRLHEPPKWLGPLSGGPLAAVTRAERGTWTGSEVGIAGVSAVTGEYGFLDLPDLAGPVSLSPDGQRLAYWVRGTPSGDPNSGWEQDGPVTGLAVRDLRSGDERRHEIETEHGLSPQTFFWADEDTLVFTFLQYTTGDSGPEDERGAASGVGGWWWNLEQDEEPARWPWVGEVPEPQFWAARDGRVLGGAGTEDTLVLLDPRDESRVVVRGEGGASRSGGDNSTLAFGPRGQVAVAEGGDEGAGPGTTIRTGRLDPEAAEIVDRRTIPDRQTSVGLLGWRDGDLLVSEISDRQEAEEGATLDVVLLDPASGEQRVLVRDTWSSYGAWDLADGLLETAEVVEAVEPPSPWDPRWVAAGWALAGIIVVVGFVSWRRRGRP